MLPHHDRILPKACRVFGVGMALVRPQPSAVAMPKSQLGIIWVGILVAGSVVADVVSPPLKGGVLKRPAAGKEKTDFDPIRTGETSV